MSSLVRYSVPTLAWIRWLNSTFARFGPNAKLRSKTNRLLIWYFRTSFSTIFHLLDGCNKMLDGRNQMPVQGDLTSPLSHGHCNTEANDASECNLTETKIVG